VPTPEWGRGGQLSGIDSTSAKSAVSSGGTPRQLWSAGWYRPGQGPSRTLVERAPSRTEGAVVGSTNVADATVSWFGPESGSTETDTFGDYEVGGLTAGTYTFIATNPGCTPDSAMVTVFAGQTLQRDFHITCSQAGRAARAHAARRPAGRRALARP
jgi:hypothetical protein